MYNKEKIFIKNEKKEELMLKYCKPSIEIYDSVDNVMTVSVQGDNVIGWDADNWGGADL